MALFRDYTQVSWYQKDKTSLDFTEARDSQCHHLGHMQVCISLKADNHASRMPFLPPNQQCQSTEGIFTNFFIQFKLGYFYQLHNRFYITATAA